MVWALGADGTMAIPMRDVSGAEAASVKVSLVCRSFAEEWPADTEIGVLESWFFEASPTARAVETYMRRQMLAIAEVETVASITATVGDSITLAAQLQIRTVDGLAFITLGEPLPYDTRGAPAYYLSSGLLTYGLGPAWGGV